MKIVLDSNEFIFAFMDLAEVQLKLFALLDDSSFEISIPSLIFDEVFERMKELTDKDFASKVRETILSSKIEIVEITKVPKKLVEKYTKKGLKDADAAIAAFTEWKRADFLISENRHFIKELKTDKFTALNAEDFIGKILK